MNRVFVFFAELSGWHLMLFGFVSTFIALYLVPIEEQAQFKRLFAPVLYFGLMYLIAPYFFYDRWERSRLHYALSYLWRKTYNHSLNMAIRDSHYSAKINGEISLTKKVWGYVYASSRVIYFIFGGIVIAHLFAGLIPNFGKAPFDVTLKALLKF